MPVNTAKINVKLLNSVNTIVTMMWNAIASQYPRLEVRPLKFAKFFHIDKYSGMVYFSSFVCMIFIAQVVYILEYYSICVKYKN